MLKLPPPKITLRRIDSKCLKTIRLKEVRDPQKSTSIIFLTNALSDLTDLVAKTSEDSNASWHPMHKTDSPSGVALQAHEANPGPVQLRDMPEAESTDPHL